MYFYIGDSINDINPNVKNVVKSKVLCKFNP